MRKKITVVIFTLFVCFLSLGIVNAEEEVVCKLGNYTLTYLPSEGLVIARNDRTTRSSMNTAMLKSEIIPQNESECPDEAYFKVLEGNGENGYEFRVTRKTEAERNEGSCAGYQAKESCESNPYFSCLWNETKYGNYCNVDNLLYVSCGDAFDIPHNVPELVSFLVNLLKIAAPLILVFVGIITMFKAVIASKEDEIKKAQSSLVKKIIASVMVFFIIHIVQFVIMKVADSTETQNISKCLTCFLNNDCKDSVYYKINVGSTYICTYVSGSKKGQTDHCKGNK